MKTRLIASSAALAVAVLALAAQGAYLFKIAVKPGDTFKYAVMVDLELQGMQIQQKYNQVQKVTKVDEDGAFHVESSQSDNAVTVGGQEVPNPGGSDKVEKSKLSPTGEIVSTDDTEQPLGIQIRLSRGMSLVDPKKGIAVGDSWSAEFAAIKKEDVPPSKITYKLIAEEKVGKHDTLKVEINFTETEGAKPVKITGFTWLDKKNFRSVKDEVSVTGFPAPPGAPVETLDVKVKQTLID
ncbi:MAG: hypothetical protein ACOYON_14605 [Fimbriimonas sp.]